MDMTKPPKKLPPVKLEDFDQVDKEIAAKLDKKWTEGLAMHQDRTRGFKLFSKVAHNMSLFEKVRKDEWSEGSTQTIMRKIRAQTIQRVPDGEIVTPFDKNSIEQATIDFLFKHKILTSEIDGKDMLKMLWKTFDSAYVYGFGCVRTGFELDLDGDPRVSYTIVPYADIVPSPDCKSIEEADWYIVREYIPFSSLKALLDCETGTVSDPTYDEKVVRYIVENEMKDGVDWVSTPLADQKKGVSNNHSIEVRTYYCRGNDEFITYVPALNAVLRKVDNYDPRNDIPLHFLILEPDPEFPYGCSQVMWTMAQQQFADAFQSTAYQTLLLSLKPPLQVFGNITNPKIKMKAGAIWPMGTNPNNRIEPYRVETTTLTGYNSILEGVSARMMASLNITDATVASDANVPHYSATPQGVEQQRIDKTITINQVQKRVEIFFSEWANHAIRSYIGSMKGIHQITVDAKTRKRIESIEEYNKSVSAIDDLKDGVPPEDHVTPPSIIDGIKVEIDFSMFDDAIFNFEVRSGSLIESEQETEKENIQEMLVAISQMLGNVSDKNRESFEQVIMQLVLRMCEIANIDISASISSTLNQNLVMNALEATMGMVANQQQQIGQMQQMLGMPQQQMAQQLPPEAMAQQLPPEAMAQQPPMAAMPPEAMGQQMPMAAMPPEAMAQQMPPVEAGGMPPDVMPAMGGEEPLAEEAVV